MKHIFTLFFIITLSVHALSCMNTSYQEEHYSQENIQKMHTFLNRYAHCGQEIKEEDSCIIPALTLQVPLNIIASICSHCNECKKPFSVSDKVTTSNNPNHICSHFFHISCIEKKIKHNQPLTCTTCNGPSFIRPLIEINVVLQAPSTILFQNINERAKSLIYKATNQSLRAFTNCGYAIGSAFIKHTSVQSIATNQISYFQGITLVKLLIIFCSIKKIEMQGHFGLNPKIIYNSLGKTLCLDFGLQIFFDALLCLTPLGLLPSPILSLYTAATSLWYIPNILVSGKKALFSIYELGKLGMLSLEQAIEQPK